MLTSKASDSSNHSSLLKSSFVSSYQVTKFKTQFQHVFANLLIYFISKFLILLPSSIESRIRAEVMQLSISLRSVGLSELNFSSNSNYLATLHRVFFLPHFDYSCCS